MSCSPFMKAVMDEVCRQNGQGIYYSVVTMQASDDPDQPYRLEKVDFQPGNPGHDCYSVSKSITSIAAGILYDRGLLKPSDTLGKYLSSYLIEGTDPKWGELTVDQLMRHRTGAREGVDFDNTLWTTMLTLSAICLLAVLVLGKKALLEEN